MATRTCTTCGADKPPDEFGRQSAARGGGPDRRCKTCTAAYVRDRYRNDPELYRAAKLRRQRKQQAKLNALKSGPCSDCGGAFHPAAMHFDHVRGEKRYTISYSALSRKDFADELAKCELRCANCHATRHALEREHATI